MTVTEIQIISALDGLHWPDAPEHSSTPDAIESMKALIAEIYRDYSPDWPVPQPTVAFDQGVEIQWSKGKRSLLIHQPPADRGRPVFCKKKGDGVNEVKYGLPALDEVRAAIAWVSKA